MLQEEEINSQVVYIKSSRDVVDPTQIPNCITVEKWSELIQIIYTGWGQEETVEDVEDLILLLIKALNLSKEKNRRLVVLNSKGRRNRREKEEETKLNAMPR